MNAACCGSRQLLPLTAACFGSGQCAEALTAACCGSRFGLRQLPLQRAAAHDSVLRLSLQRAAAHDSVLRRSLQRAADNEASGSPASPGAVLQLRQRPAKPGPRAEVATRRVAFKGAVTCLISLKNRATIWKTD
jgi:hypothetical protein